MPNMIPQCASVIPKPSMAKPEMRVPNPVKRRSNVRTKFFFCANNAASECNQAAGNRNVRAAGPGHDPDADLQTPVWSRL